MKSYPLRLTEHVMEEARRAAAEDNISLNQFLSSLIADGIGHRRAVMDLKCRAERGDADKALAILSRAPDVEPASGDERT